MLFLLLLLIPKISVIIVYVYFPQSLCCHFHWLFHSFIIAIYIILVSFRVCSIALFIPNHKAINISRIRLCSQLLDHVGSIKAPLSVFLAIIYNCNCRNVQRRRIISLRKNNIWAMKREDRRCRMRWSEVLQTAYSSVYFLLNACDKYRSIVKTSRSYYYNTCMFY